MFSSEAAGRFRSVCRERRKEEVKTEKIMVGHFGETLQGDREKR